MYLLIPSGSVLNVYSSMLRIFIVTALLLSACSCSLLPFNKKKESTDGGSVEAPKISVEVTGVNSAVEKNILSLIGVAQKRCDTPVKLLKRRHDKTREEVRSAMEAFGYYEASIDLSFDTSKDCPQLNISIEPGRVILLENIEVIIKGPAKEQKEFSALVDELLQLKGKELNHGEYESAKTSIESLAAEMGYFDGYFVDAKLTIDLDTYRASAYLEYESKERYSLGTITNNSDELLLNDDIVERLIEAPDDTEYHADKIVDIQNRLTSSGYFSSVEALPNIDAPAEREIPVHIQLKEIERHKFQAALGFATDEGIRTQLGYTNRIWNDDGHTWGVSTRISQIERSLTSYYQIPREFPSNEQLKISAYLAQREVDTFETNSALLSVNESKRRPFGIIENHFVSYSMDDFEIGSESNNANLLIVGANWNYRIADQSLYPRQAFNVTWGVRGAAEPLISDTSFINTNIGLNYIQALPFDFRFISRSNLGAIWVDEFRSLPPTERFFAGGDKSIRGYDFQDLGPVNTLGEVIGGEYLGIFSVELEKYLTRKWGVAAFVDTGNAFGGPGSDTGLKTGIGLGVRWRSPVGPVRVDLAHPLDDDDTLVKFHLRIGPEF